MNEDGMRWALWNFETETWDPLPEDRNEEVVWLHPGMLAAAMNDAQIEPEEIALGHDLSVPAGRVLEALKAASRG